MRIGEQEIGAITRTLLPPIIGAMWEERAGSARND
jgi:hypothetical protein